MRARPPKSTSRSERPPKSPTWGANPVATVPRGKRSANATQVNSTPGNIATSADASRTFAARAAPHPTQASYRFRSSRPSAVRVWPIATRKTAVRPAWPGKRS